MTYKYQSNRYFLWKDKDFVFLHKRTYISDPGRPKEHHRALCGENTCFALWESEEFGLKHQDLGGKTVAFHLRLEAAAPGRCTFFNRPVPLCPSETMCTPLLMTSYTKERKKGNHMKLALPQEVLNGAPIFIFLPQKYLEVTLWRASFSTNCR